MGAVDAGLAGMLMAVFAGVASVASPCVLPVVPIIVTGTEKDHRLRPLLIVSGLSLSFMTMGVVTALFGGAVAGLMPVLEKIAGLMVLLFGVLMLLDVNLFKGLTWFSRVPFTAGGPWSGLVLGLTLGLVWIPCVGPLLSGVLALVATDGRLATGLLLLALYSIGFALPMLLLGYASQSARQRIKGIAAHPFLIRLLSGGLLIAFGIYILTQGMLL